MWVSDSEAVKRKRNKKDSRRRNEEKKAGDYISVHQEFKRNIWKHPLGNDFDMVVSACVCVCERAIMAEQKRGSCPPTQAHTKLAPGGGIHARSGSTCGW